MSQAIERIGILGVQVACVDWSGLISQVQAWVEHDQRCTVYYANAHTLNLAYQQPDFCSLLNEGDLVYADGRSVVWAGRWLGGQRLTKLTGARWIDAFCQHALAQGWRIYLLGGKPGIAHIAAETVTAQFVGLQVVGTADGYFLEKSEEQVLAEIEALKPDVLLVGMGSPLQERWLSAHRGVIKAKVCWAVGALLDYVAGKERRAPGWLDRLGFEWAWRFALDPAGKWRRYLLGNPLFIFRVLLQKFWRTKSLEQTLIYRNFTLVVKSTCGKLRICIAYCLYVQQIFVAHLWRWDSCARR